MGTEEKPTGAWSWSFTSIKCWAGSSYIHSFSWSDA